MAIITLTPTNLQKVEFNVTTAEGPSRVTIITGKIFPDLVVVLGGPARINQIYKVLVEPALTVAKFRKAVATAALGGISRQGILTASSVTTGRSVWIINDAQAFFDDDAGRIQLLIDVAVIAEEEEATVTAITFQVTTLSKI
jgi:hypothetical protein